MRIGVITNLKAGRGASDAQSVLERVKACPDVTSVVTDPSTNVAEVLGEFDARDIEVLVVNGGDGTLQRTLTEVLGDASRERTPIIAPLRSGRTNSSARDLGADGNPLVAVDKIIDLSRKGGLEAHTVRRNVLKVTLEPDSASAQTHFGMFCGFGVIDRAIRITHERFPEGRAQGALGGAVTAVSLIAQLVTGRGRDSHILGADPMRVTFDKEPANAGAYHLAIASTLDRAFLSLRPFWGTGDGPVRITTIAEGARHTLRGLVRVVRGLPPDASGPREGYVSRNVDCADLRVDCGLTIDGELFDPAPARTVRIEARENVSFLRS